MNKNSSLRRYVLVANNNSRASQPIDTEIQSRPALEEDGRARVLKLPWWSGWVGAGIIVSLGLYLYGHTLSYPFQFDDHTYLLRSPFIKDMGDFIFRNDFQTVATYSRQLGTGMDPSVNFILRPVAYLTFHLNYVLDGFNPRGYRMVNIGIHCANALLLFFLISHLLRKSPKSSQLTTGSLLFVPLAAALLFVSHPLHTESVTYIVQRFTSLVGFCVLSSTFLHFLSLAASGRMHAMILRVLSVIVMACGMLTKESMFTAPLLIVMLHVVVMEGTIKRACWQALPHFLCMLIIPALVLLTSYAQTGSHSIGEALHIAASFKEADYRYHYFLTQLGVVIEYAGLILWPHSLNVDREYPLATSLFESRVIFSACAIAAIIGVSWWLQRSRKNSIHHALICGSVFWYFLRLAVSSSFVPLDDLMVDHRTYGASMGMLTALACGIDMVRTRLSRWSIGRLAVPACLMIWITTLSVTTLKRNDVWKSEISLWRDAVAKSPGKARPWDNLAVCHYDEGRVEEALACLEKAMEVDAFYIPAYIKIAAVLNAFGRHSEAIKWLEKGVEMIPNYPDMRYQLGMSLCKAGRTNEGMDALVQTINIMPAHFPAQAALGQLYRERRRYKAALFHYKKAESLGYQDPEMSRTIIHLELLTGQR